MFRSLKFLFNIGFAICLPAHVAASPIESPQSREAIRDKVMNKKKPSAGSGASEEKRISAAVEKLTPEEQKIFHRVRQSFSEFYAKDSMEHPEFHLKLAKEREYELAPGRREMDLVRGRGKPRKHDRLREAFLGRYWDFIQKSFPETQEWGQWSRNGLFPTKKFWRLSRGLRMIEISAASNPAASRSGNEFELRLHFGTGSDQRAFDVAIKFEGEKGSTVGPWRYRRGPLSEVVETPKDHQVCQIRHSVLEMKVKDLAKDVASFLEGGELSPRHHLELEGFESEWRYIWQNRKFDQMVGEAFANPQLCQDYRRSNAYHDLKDSYRKIFTIDLSKELRSRPAKAGK